MAIKFCATCGTPLNGAVSCSSCGRKYPENISVDFSSDFTVPNIVPTPDNTVGYNNVSPVVDANPYPNPPLPTPEQYYSETPQNYNTNFAQNTEQSGTYTYQQAPGYNQPDYNATQQYQQGGYPTQPAAVPEQPPVADQSAYPTPTVAFYKEPTAESLSNHVYETENTENTKEPVKIKKGVFITMLSLIAIIVAGLAPTTILFLSENSSITAENAKNIAQLTQLEADIDFVNENIAFIAQDSQEMEYHTMDCEIFLESETFLAYNIKQATERGYHACDICHD